MAFLLRHGRWGVACPRFVRAYAQRVAQYRPLPDPSVAWRADEAEVARRVALQRHMPFAEADAVALPAMHASLAHMRAERTKLENEQQHIGATIPRLAQSQGDPERLMQLRGRARELRTVLRELSQRIDDASARSLEIRLAWPNRMHPDVPIGPESASRVVVVHDARAGASALPGVSLPCSQHEFDACMEQALVPRPERDHLSLAHAMPDGGVDMAAGLTTTGPSWPYLIGTLSMLEHALCQYALHVAQKHGFVPVSVPDVVKTDIAERCGFRPRDEAAAQTYFVDTRRDVSDAAGLCLAGTAEIPLAALVAKHTYDARGPSGTGDVRHMALPIRLTALGHAFRAEAGARGADTRGLYRIHQFSKVELFAVTTPDESDRMLESLREVQQDMVEGLGLLYRVLDMSSEELGASAYRKYDIEAWMPGRGAWGEICSASNCTDYQARRLAIKYRDAESGKNTYAHTLNATAAAIPRLQLALLETYASTRLALPSTLRPFWLGGPKDPRVEWIDLRAPSTIARAHAQLRAIAQRTGAKPAPLLLAFAILHELTALVPLFVLAFVLTTLGAGDAILRSIDAAIQHVAPSEHDRLSAWIDRGSHMARRLSHRLGTDASASPAAWLTSLTASYVVVKLLLPVRIAASLALAPVTARAMVRCWRRT